MIQNRIIKTELIDWSIIKPIQPDNLKNIINKDIIINSINKFGFAMPFFVWQKNNDIYAIDGHTRKEILSQMENVPKLLPATFINAKNKKEAIQILLNVYNQKQNQINVEVFNQWIEEESIEVTEIDIESLDFKKEIRNIIGNNYEPEKDVNNKDYCIVYLEKFHLPLIDNIKMVKNLSSNEDAIIYLIENFKI